MNDVQFFSDTQLANLETCLGAAERDMARQLSRPVIETGAEQQYLELNAVNFLRRLLVEVQHHRANAAQPADARRPVA